MASFDITAFETFAGLLIVLEPAGVIFYWNRATSELVGRPLDEVRGQHLWNYLALATDPATVEDAIRHAATTLRSGRFVTTLAARTGELRTIAFTASVVGGAEGAAHHIVLNGVDITDYIADRESALARLGALLEQAPDGIFVADLEGRYTDVNDAGCRLLGYSRRELVGKRITDIIPPEEVDRLWETRAQLLQGRVIVSRWTLRRKDGSFVPVEVSAKILPDGRWQGFVRDITERLHMEQSLRQSHADLSHHQSIAKVAEQALRVSEERLRVALQASPAVVFNQDLELRYTWIHNPKEPFVAEQVLGKTDFDLLPHADAEQLSLVKRQVLETGTGARTIVRTTIAGEALYYDLTVEPIRDQAGRTIGITCATWDVTEQQRVEQNQRFLAEAGAILLSATLDYEQILEHLARLAVRGLADWFLVDIIEAGKVYRLRVAHSDPTKSELAARLEAVQLDRTRPHLFFESLHHRRTKLVSHVTDIELQSLAQNDEHLRMLRALNMRSFISVPLISRGRLLGAFALVSSSDVRRYREWDVPFAEEFARVAALAVENAQLHQETRRAITARDEVLGIVAHDLRSPLNTVLMTLEFLRGGDGEPGCRSQKSVDVMVRAARRMNRLIQDMLDIARIESGALAVERAAVVTRSLLEEAFQGQQDKASGAGLHLRLAHIEELPDVLADHDRLLQVFDNLIGNAVKFTPPGGDVVLGAEMRAGEVLFWVADTGSGISEEHVRHLFDRFWQAKRTDRRGAGLGLPIVKGIVESHGGRVWVESQMGKGSTFYFTVPVAPSGT